MADSHKAGRAKQSQANESSSTQKNSRARPTTTVFINPATGSQVPSVRLGSRVGGVLLPSADSYAPGTVIVARPREALDQAINIPGRVESTVATTATSGALSSPAESTTAKSMVTRVLPAPEKILTRSRGRKEAESNTSSRRRRTVTTRSSPEKKLQTGRIAPSPKKGSRAKGVAAAEGKKRKALDVGEGPEHAQKSKKERLESLGLLSTMHVDLTPTKTTSKRIKPAPQQSSSAAEKTQQFHLSDAACALTDSYPSTVIRRQTPTGVDIRVRVTPGPCSSLARKHTAADHNYHIADISEWKVKTAKLQTKIDRLRKEQKNLRIKVFRSNQKAEKLMKSLILEQKMHNETQQTLRAIMQGLQLEVTHVASDAAYP